MLVPESTLAVSGKGAIGLTAGSRRTGCPVGDGARRCEATPVSHRGRQAGGEGTGHAVRERAYRRGRIRGRGPFLALERPAKDQSTSGYTDTPARRSDRT